MKRIAILQSNYIPWKGYFDLIAAVDEFIIYDCVQYTKHDWRNRNQIKTAQGKSWLTIPVRQQSLGQTIEQTRIADPSCFRRHWTSFRQAYAKAPHLEYCNTLLSDIFLDETPPAMLSDANRRLIERICNGLGINTRISSAVDYSPSGDRMERLLDLCLKTGASHYLSGPAARAYVDEARFAQAGVIVDGCATKAIPSIRSSIRRRSTISSACWTCSRRPARPHPMPCCLRRRAI